MLLIQAFDDPFLAFELLFHIGLALTQHAAASLFTVHRSSFGAAQMLAAAFAGGGGEHHNAPAET